MILHNLISTESKRQAAMQIYEDISDVLSPLWRELEPTLIQATLEVKTLLLQFLVYLSINYGPIVQKFAKKSQALYYSLAEQDFLLKFLFIIVAFGTINWSIWLLRRVRSTFYRPFYGDYYAKTSVVIPVYKEKIEVLRNTIESILKNGADEIIIILDISEQQTMNFIQKNYKDNPKIRADFIDIPGKRPALAKGIRMARYDIVVLVDSDTSWKGENFLRRLIVPFQDPKVGGVGSRQEVNIRASWAQKIIDWNLDLKYSDYIKSDSISGSVLCLSGRTAAYRRRILLPILEKLTHEYFLGHQCMGGDDTRLTTLVLMQGYNTVYQDICVARSEFHPSLSVYLKQKVRWSRNSFRAYLRALFSRWPWKQNRWIYLISAYHTIFPGLTSLLGFAFFFLAIYLKAYIFAFIWLGWTFIGRLIKGHSHLKKKPSDFYLLPMIIVYYFLLSFIKLYALLTITKESWSGSRGSYKLKRGSRVV